MNNRAYSVLEVRAFDDDSRKFSGIATTPSVDRVGDIIEPEGVRFANPMPLLHQHRHDAPIGSVKFKKPTKDGIEFEAEIARVEEPGPLQDRVDTAWGEVKYGLVRATSIGFRPIEYSFMDNGGIRYSEIEVYELSTVTIPANADAVISAVKSFDAAARKAAGVPDPEIPLPGSVPPGQLNIVSVNSPRFIVGERSPEILSPPEPAASGKSARVVRLNAPPASRQPFIIREIRRTSQ